MKPCKYIDCNKPIYCKNKCYYHYQKEYRNSNREYLLEQKKLYHRQNREQIASKELVQKYGITIQEKFEKLLTQNGCCAIYNEYLVCNGIDLVDILEKACVDHDHATDIVRDILCNRCNRCIGLLQDNPNIVYAAYLYLIKWKDM